MALLNRDLQVTITRVSQSGKRKNWERCRRVETFMILMPIYACTFIVNININVSNNDGLNLKPQDYTQCAQEPVLWKSKG